MTGSLAWRSELAVALGAVARAEPIAGGDINDAWRIDLADGRRVFVKSHAAPPPGMYAAEADGLAWLSEGSAPLGSATRGGSGLGSVTRGGSGLGSVTRGGSGLGSVTRGGPLRVPRVLAVGASFLALEWLDLGGGGRDASFEERLGRGLAQLHSLGAPTLGHRRDNYVATLPQDNAAAPDVPTLWIEHRLRPTITRLGEPSLLDRLDRLAARPDRFGPSERPARLHGDLWWGNVSSTRSGDPVIFDPAVYGGPREIDLAMLALFGGLGDTLIAAYQEVWPLASDWRSRLGLWQLYPLAVHAVLFGGGYIPQLARGLDAALA